MNVTNADHNKGKRLTCNLGATYNKHNELLDEWINKKIAENNSSR